MIQKISDILEHILKWALIIITGAMILIIIYQVFGRYVLNSAPSWTEEIARFCLVWMSFLGAALIVRYKTNIRVEFFVEKLFSARTKARLDLLIDFLIISFSLFMVVYGIIHVSHTWKYSSEALHIPMPVLNLTIPVSGLFATIFSLADIVAAFRKRSQQSAIEKERTSCST